MNQEMIEMYLNSQILSLFFFFYFLFLPYFTTVILLHFFYSMYLAAIRSAAITGLVKVTCLSVREDQWKRVMTFDCRLYFVLKIVLLLIYFVVFINLCTHFLYFLIVS